MGRSRRECSGLAVPIDNPEDVKTVPVASARNDSAPLVCPSGCNDFCGIYSMQCCGFDGVNCYCCPHQESCCL